MRGPHIRPVALRLDRLLRSHRYFQDVRDLDRTRGLVGGLYCSHRMDLAERGPLNAWMNAVTRRSVVYSSLGYGAASVVVPGTTESFFPIMIPLTGGGDVQVGRQQVAVSTRMAAVVSASEPLSMRLSRDCTLMIACIDRAALESQASEMIGEPLSSPLRFTAAMDVTQRRPLRWRRQLLDDVDDLDSPDSLILADDFAAHYAEQRLMTDLLLTQPHNYSDRMAAGPVLALSARVVRAVTDVIEANPSFPHTPASLAAQACCSVRKLHTDVKHHTGKTPMAYVHERRLRWAREKLTAAQPGSRTVARIAASCGFTHLGRFGQQYKRRFGETPSTTLGRC